MRRFACMVAVLAGCFAAGTARAAAPDCPNGGTVHFGAIPDMAQLLPIFQGIGGLIPARLDCNVVAQAMKCPGRKHSHRLAPVDDHSYHGIRDVVSVLHLDLSTMTA